MWTMNQGPYPPSQVYCGSTWKTRELGYNYLLFFHWTLQETTGVDKLSACAFSASPGRASWLVWNREYLAQTPTTRSRVNNRLSTFLYVKSTSHQWYRPVTFPINPRPTNTQQYKKSNPENFRFFIITRYYCSTDGVKLVCHPDAICIRIILMPTIIELSVISGACKRVMSETRTHDHVLVQTLEILVVELLHPSSAIDLSVDFEHLGVRVMVVDPAVGFTRAKPYIHLDLVFLGGTLRRRFIRPGHNVWVEGGRSNFKLGRLVQRDVLWEVGRQWCQLVPPVFQHYPANVSTFRDLDQHQRVSAGNACAFKKIKHVVKQELC